MARAQFRRPEIEWFSTRHIMMNFPLKGSICQAADFLSRALYPVGMISEHA